ncbi:MAG: DNA alkylation repair protein [Candidatus Paceibacterota bacterium]|jgi:3-methyladenine DNA glycosylase AlkD
MKLRLKSVSVRTALQSFSDPVKASILKKFFKTGPGEYGEGDLFIGVVVPDIRRVAKEYSRLPFQDILKLLKSSIHEERLCALFILVSRYEYGTDEEQKQIYEMYLSHTRYINNWDLVDLTAPKIVGAYARTRGVLEDVYKLVQSKNLWERRIAVLACFYFIKNDDFKDTLKIAKILLKDSHDLIHKAVGWMLREVGKRDVVIEKTFLATYYKKMPRTMLRYAIERFPEVERKQYLLGNM